MVLSLKIIVGFGTECLTKYIGSQQLSMSMSIHNIALHTT